ncbi:MAG: iron-only hydrogenase system regulator [Clostridia bacterium]|nr:iron-only hydrogenase system regulator [Clostridia bacterium]
MENRIAVVSIIVECPESVKSLNAILHDYAKYIIGRMGIPCRERKLSVISIVMDGPQDEISALSGKVGRLEGVTSKTAYSKL